MLEARIRGVGVLGPGLSDWPQLAAIFRGERGYESARTLLPAPSVLPAAERRRAGRVVKLALAVGAEAVASARTDTRTLPSVFSSSGGDGDNCHELCSSLATERPLLSPTRFHNSVHNAASGYWSIAYGCTAPITALCAREASFGAGLIEALAQLACGAEAVLLVAYDADDPPPLQAGRTIPDAFGLALLLASAQRRADEPRLQLELDAGAPSRLEAAPLETLRQTIPAARGLPLLERLARGERGELWLDYLDHVTLAVRLELSA
jgi:hypothetical protein